MSCKFERVKRFANDETILLPERSTVSSAGYDFYVAEDVVLYPINTNFLELPNECFGQPQTLEQAKTLLKQYNLRPYLISTGIKAIMPNNCYLEIMMRSSTPLNYMLIQANGIGIIDADYANNENNDGEIYFQIINMNTFPVQLKKGDKIGQGIFKQYLTIDNDTATKERIGGFGSTDN